MYISARERLESFGYVFGKNDGELLKSSVSRTENAVKSNCGLCEIPEELLNIATDMAVGEFLAAKKTLCPGDIDCLDLNAAVKSIKVGDTSTVFALGEGCLTDEQRFDAFVDYLMHSGKNQLNSFRRVKW